MVPAKHPRREGGLRLPYTQNCVLIGIPLRMGPWTATPVITLGALPPCLRQAASSEESKLVIRRY